MINYNKLYSELFSVIFIYVIMTIFELLFFVLVVCPIISEHTHELLNSFKIGNNQNIENNWNFLNVKLDPNPLKIAKVLSAREYQLINNFNLGNYLIIIVIVLLLISLLFYLYTRIGIIEDVNSTEVINSKFESEISGINPDIESRQNSLNLDRVNSSYIVEEEHTLARRTASQNTNMTSIRKVRRMYLKRAIKSAFATLSCLIFYQIFFYYYGLEFKYVGSTNELIVLFVETLRN